MNPDTMLTLDDAVEEVLVLLTGQDLTYQPEQDRYRVIARQLNRALRQNALEKDWSCYASVETLGTVRAGETSMSLRGSRRPRVINDDAVRLVDDDGAPVVWAYFLPRDALHKYRAAGGLWCAMTGSRLDFSRPFMVEEEGLSVQLPVMREPVMFRLPAQGVAVDQTIRDQPIDFPYPDVIVARASWLYAQTDPIMQPRVQTLEAQYKDLMYQLIERDDQNTDSPYINGFILPVVNGISTSPMEQLHPHANAWRR